MIFRDASSPGDRRRVARLQIMDRFGSMDAKDGWMVSFALAPSLCLRWPVGAPLPPPAGPGPRLALSLVIQVSGWLTCPAGGGHGEDKVRASRMETQGHPKISEPSSHRLIL